MYNVIKFTDKDGTIEYLASKKSISYFRKKFNPELVAIEIETLSDAIDLARYFNRKIVTKWDELMSPPIFYKEPRVVKDIPDMEFPLTWKV